MNRSAGPAWCGIFGFVIAYDYWAIRSGNETLSGACWRHLERYPDRIVATLIATMLYKHLVAPNVLPQTDPLKFLADRWHRSYNDKSTRQNQ